MTVSRDTEARALFEDARRMHAAAMEQLEGGDIRDAAEKAWCATRRATDALILARMGVAPGPTGFTTDQLDALGREDRNVKETLAPRYYSRITNLHGRCFYEGACNPETERRIRETADYIADAEAMARG